MHSSFESLIKQYPLPIAEQLRRWAARYASRIAVVDAKGSLTYRALDARVDELAAGLSSLGLRPGEHVIVQLPNGNAFVILLFALLRMGVIPVLAMPSQRALDIDALIELAQPVAYVIHGENHAELARQMTQKHACLRHVLSEEESVSNDFTPLFSLRGERQEWPLPDVSGTALLLLSGGTTGTPKLIPRRHADYSYNFSASAELCGINQQSVYLAVLPVAHNFPLACPGILGTLSCGGKVVLADSASCDEVMPLIAHERVTHIALVPALAQLWMQAREWEHSDLSSLRVIQVGGARLDPTLAEQVIATFDCTLQQVFGMAEGLLCFTRLDDPRATVLHSQGRPLSPLDEVRIVDEDENDVAPGETGQLLTRGPYTISGYYRAPAHNAQAFTAQRFYRTGDNVRMDEAGNLHVEGRIKEQINRAGEKIAAAEIESVLMRLVEVKDCAVVAAPDTLLGERICAFVIAQQTPSDYQQLRQQLNNMGLSAWKIPDQIEFLSHWPLTAVGKIDKKRLTALAVDRHRNTAQ
ncbi:MULTISPECIES: yersiniabactin biosynthesis salycil-AMP ligase YbtE [Brenneria]|uniref:Yersiniabactin biosynthesis salycil-AMP ligase YbtE n=1 Tax=Brenneria nigrifluens DSM 30175 = ATCC 13028 TaxID=1121120 RepID=A0A2U1UPL7_9GAMM|nr:MULTISPECIES: yersiniabactin biosynthesis salycil-AMP ligase YbtE [Brenneria]EHD21421.1 (2,3-dihydroxybenzoyl)adenylate synthase [Brenneria sp. EniD312]PWC23564.1 yersiniabactin biosynthesis salycil-AMP ligase YbtE [Brenneria nigrifluens DSM 30175 = ATCC 13028]QCR04546.1 yersiniabactin biosynthesis salycil-AMP ligase YbtE [Brenneria nigrifluens DSM 30175 = ATCC 13028]